MIEPTIRSKVRRLLSCSMCGGAKRGAGVLQHFQENPCCKHIVLGSCHDNGYVCHLDVIRSEGSLRDRITLLKSFQTGRQYGDLPFKSIRLPSLFRTRAFSASAPLHAVHPAPKNGSRNGITSTPRCPMRPAQVLPIALPSNLHPLYPSTQTIAALYW
jgi:hypothetical protein